MLIKFGTLKGVADVSKVQRNGGDELEIVNRGKLFKKCCWEGLKVELNLR